MRRASQKPPRAAVRQRRTPEEAKALILEAAARVFAEHLPDTVGLKDVARAAGVSHALVTHYFGTYDALVEATLEDRFHRVRAEMVPVVQGILVEEGDARAILGAHRRAIAKAASDPATVRLLTWAMLSGRVAADDFFAHRMRGLELLADAASSSSSAPREDIEFLLIASFALTAVVSIGKRAFAGALGRKPSRELDRSIEERIDAMLDGYLAAAERKAR